MLTASILFYREAGNPENPPVLLLPGFPTSSIMFKNLMTALSDRLHLVAPDYPGFGFSDFPAKEQDVQKFVVQDFNPDNISTLIVKPK